MTDDEALQLGARVAGGFIDSDGDGVFDVPGQVFSVTIARIAVPAFVAELLVTQVKDSPGAVEYALIMAGMEGAWTSAIARIRAALVALGYKAAGEVS